MTQYLKLHCTQLPRRAIRGTNLPSFPDNDIRSSLDEDDTADIIFPLSSEMEDLSRGYDSLSRALVTLLDNSEVLYESAWAASIMVFRLNENIIFKAGHENYSVIEHQTLLFLQEHMPDFPVLMLHSLVRLGIPCFLFTSHILGTILEKAWPELDYS